MTCSAAPTVQAWYHFGDTSATRKIPAGTPAISGQPTPTSHPTTPLSAGSFSGIITPTGVGGPLGTSGYTSTTCTRAGYFSTRICTTWGTGYNPPSTNFFIEISVLPYGKGYMGGSAWLFSSGQKPAAMPSASKTTAMEPPPYVATILGYGDIGSPVPLDTNRWIHLAMVNDNGVTTFYTNGVACGRSDHEPCHNASAGDMYHRESGCLAGPGRFAG